MSEMLWLMTRYAQWVSMKENIYDVTAGTYGLWSCLVHSGGDATIAAKCIAVYTLQLQTLPQDRGCGYFIYILLH
jgi:hypothetical protein